MDKKESTGVWSQLRRCHRCFSFNESLGDRVFKCGACKAHFAPYFFAEFKPEALSSRAQSLVLTSAKRYRPVVGLTWWWTESDTSSDNSSGERFIARA